MQPGPDNFDIDAVIAETERQVASLGEMQRRMSEVIGEAHGPQRLAYVQTTANGALSRLSIDPRGMRLDSHSLAEEITAAATAAAADAAARISEITLDVLGEPADGGFDPGTAPTAPDLSRDPAVQEALNEIARLRSQLG